MGKKFPIITPMSVATRIDPTLLEQTETLLVAALDAGMSLRDVAPKEGPIEYDWLKKFSAGKIADPSVNRIQALHDRLAELKLI